MSLSFPGLISAVPLWTRDFTLIERPSKISSDGVSSVTVGYRAIFQSISSIIFCRTVQPLRSRSTISMKSAIPSDRLAAVRRAAEREPVTDLAFERPGQLSEAARLFRQGLAGQSAEHACPVIGSGSCISCFKPDEGGLNLTMDRGHDCKKLIDYGSTGRHEMLRDKFDLDAHRWRRFLVAMARMEETLDEVAQAYEQVPGKFGDFLDRICKRSRTVIDTLQRLQDPTKCLTNRIRRSQSG